MISIEITDNAPLLLSLPEVFSERLIERIVYLCHAKQQVTRGFKQSFAVASSSHENQAIFK